ncbi:cell wall-binding repeat-containing protein [Microbacterium sp. ARD32]|uniref:cell wall-binding repeat-containing protein n=1 Tax=Microbacterium sp. ARD32 TaxID=2962577 RepID=UPI00288226D7|nr:cell wall-binding repeat-containing protein [Microbacterium sp. ARD32]MDT0156762.1 cell wall-binding repeat-containing protein [Microbacterium sp. ARD32]
MDFVMLNRVLASALSAAVVVAASVTAPAASAAVTTASDLTSLLSVAAADTTHSYERSAFEHWIDADGDGCNTRYEVLITASTTPVTIDDRCRLSGGTWVSAYDGFNTHETTQIQIDHVVALAEAWRSGAWAWTDSQRREFANDLTVPYALTVASNTANQSKSDKDPALWMPTNTAYRCEYAISWALVKFRWSLAVDPAEHAALERQLSGACGTTPVTLPDKRPVSSPTDTPPHQTATTSPPAGITRLSGADRYGTAVAVSKRYSPGVPAAFVATGQSFPDALSAAAAAAHLGGPLLLTSTGSLPAAIREELVRLKPKKIYVTGATGAVSRAVESALRHIAPVQRLGGATRYDTGDRIVREVFDRAEHVFIATGRAFPDALAATGAAGSVHGPVILVDGTQRAVPTTTLALLRGLDVRSVTLVGGTGAVSAGIDHQLRAQGYRVDRLAGIDRYETSARINTAYFPAGAASTAFLATGQNFPDALAGAALAGRSSAPVYVTRAACVPEEPHRGLVALGAPSTIVLGGTTVVSDDAAANLGCLTTAVPTISGSARVGSVLTARPGDWTAATAFTYRWLADGHAIKGVSGKALTLTAAMAGRQISVAVTGRKSGYTSSVTTSVRTKKVAYPGRTAPSGYRTCPSWAPIKGNADSYIYHLPGGRYYDRTDPEECFRSEGDARSAGYRRSKV